MPALVKVKLKLLPGVRPPEFQTAVLLVVVCVVPSLLVHVTVSPTLIVRLFGLNAKPEMSIGTVIASTCGGSTIGAMAGRDIAGATPQKTSA